MASTDIFFLVGAFSLFAIAVALVPALVQLRRTLRKTESFVDALNRHIDPMCKSVADAAAELQVFYISMNERVEQADAILKNVRNATETLTIASSLARDTLKPFITSFGGLAAGVKAFSYLIARRKKQGDPI